MHGESWLCGGVRSRRVCQTRVQVKCVRRMSDPGVVKLVRVCVCESHSAWIIKDLSGIRTIQVAQGLWSMEWSVS